MKQPVSQYDKFAATILRLRDNNFKKNIPFLILSEGLPEGQGYREFNDGRIELHEVYSEGAKVKSRVLRTLSQAEALKVRKDNGLY